MYRRDCLQAQLDPVLNNILRSVTHSRFPCGGFIPQVILLLVAKHGLFSLKLESTMSCGEESYPCVGSCSHTWINSCVWGTRYASRFKPVGARQGLPLVLGCQWQVLTLKALKAVWRQVRELWGLVNRWGHRRRVSTRGARSSLGEAWSHVKLTDNGQSSRSHMACCEGGT